jgi:hypothetical protein
MARPMRARLDVRWQVEELDAAMCNKRRQRHQSHEPRSEMFGRLASTALGCYTCARVFAWSTQRE